MDKELIKQAIDKCDLVDIYLNTSQIQRKPKFVELDADFTHLVQQHKRRIRAEFLEAAKAPEQEHSSVAPYLLYTTIDFGVRMVEQDKASQDNPNVLAEIEASFCAVYRCQEKLTDDEIREFSSFNAVHNVWPFWREHALRVSAEARLPRPNIPLMKLKG